jgi:septal ring factor EnvC (AmiA/AmiB activator)
MGKGLTVIVKNQHLLGGLVVVGAINVLAFMGVISAERDRARFVYSLEQQLNGAREEQRKSVEHFGQETEDLRHQLDEARGVINTLHEEVGKVQSQLARTRRTLEAIEERLEKSGTKEGGGKE